MIQNNNKRFFGYAFFYFLERELLLKKHCYQASLYKKMFQRNHLDTLPYLILPNNVHLYKDQLQINITAFFVFDKDGRARHPVVISRKTHEILANLLY